ncbi:Pectinesterase inhibitor [Cardamine amara subsp. amara]|uniref:Pectinesterase inhibitor n=1 Tax=Cardamine amara subsp. amara TaxID=228776 RepID=A0ABD1B2G6_CARAN
MVAYISKNFSLGLIVILSLFVVSSYARLSMMVTKGEIDAICTKKGVNSTLCFEVLKPTPEISTLDISGLAKFVINYENQKVSDTQMHVTLFAVIFKSINASKELCSAYQKCAYLYKDVSNSLDSSLKALAAKDYIALNVGVGASITKTNTCGHYLSTTKQMIPKDNQSIAEDLLMENTVIKDLFDIILVTLKRLEKKKY